MLMRLYFLALASLTLAACTSQDMPAERLDVWPELESPVGLDPSIESKIDDLISRMSTPQKVGQMIQAEIKSITPSEAAKYHIGSILNGGGVWPADSAISPVTDWLTMADSFYDASMDTSSGQLAIPILWGTDAVHGHNNVSVATIFPHNIGLRAANNPALMRRIGAITAREVAVTGIDWTFAPTVATAQDVRWGRTYESYSSDPDIVALLSKEIVIGLQGHPNQISFLDEDKIIATAKHFIGDGGTARGDDQGETTLTEEDLFDIHGQGYVQTIGAGVQTVMASFNSWNGDKLHGHTYLLTQVLKGQMGFDGFVIGDWNGHAQVKGCRNSSCPNVIKAGVDMIMVPTEWKKFHQNTVWQVNSSEIPMARIDDAVRRILRVKLRAGMFEDGKPSEHAFAGRTELIGHPGHRAVARQAVRESLVLLKNDGILPLNPARRVLITGSAAHNPAHQSGGWTVSWQGRDADTKEINSPDIYIGHTTIFEAFTSSITDSGGTIATTFDAANKPDAAILVFGEDPYAEFEGDIARTDFNLSKNADFKQLQSLRAEGIPVVVIFLSGRPRGVDAVIDLSSAFVAAWLPGSEGAGLADVILSGGNGTEYDFKGRLPFAWPASGATKKVPAETRFERGFGLTFSAPE